MLTGELPTEDLYPNLFVLDFRINWGLGIGVGGEGSDGRRGRGLG